MIPIQAGDTLKAVASNPHCAPVHKNETVTVVRSGLYVDNGQEYFEYVVNNPASLYEGVEFYGMLRNHEGTLMFRKCVKVSMSELQAKRSK